MSTLEGKAPGHRKTLPVLLYHDIGPLSRTPGLRDYIIEPSLFEEHLAALSDAGYSTFRANQLPSLELSSEPERAVVITFDDAFANLAEVGPLIERRHMTATVVVPTALIGGRAVWLDPMGEGQRPVLGWEQLRALRDIGVEIACHGHEHEPLDLLPRGLLASELRRGRTILEEGLG